MADYSTTPDKDLSPAQLVAKYHAQRIGGPKSTPAQRAAAYDKLAGAGVTGTDKRIGSTAQRQSLAGAQGRRAGARMAAAGGGDESFSKVGSDPGDVNQVRAAQAQAGGMGGVGGEISGAPEGMGLREVAGLAGGMTAGMLAGRRTAPAVRGAVAHAAEAARPLIENVLSRTGPMVNRVEDMAAAMGMPVRVVAAQVASALRKAGSSVHDMASEAKQAGRPPQGEPIGPDVPKAPPKKGGRQTQQARQQAAADVNARTAGPGTAEKTTTSSGIRPTRRGQKSYETKATPPSKKPSTFEKDITARAKSTESSSPESLADQLEKSIGAANKRKAASPKPKGGSTVQDVADTGKQKVARQGGPDKTHGRGAPPRKRKKSP